MTALREHLTQPTAPVPELVPTRENVTGALDALDRFRDAHKPLPDHDLAIGWQGSRHVAEKAQARSRTWLANGAHGMDPHEAWDVYWECVHGNVPAHRPCGCTT
jgi:hypothetical protein